MNPEIKAKWVAALRSGEYAQTEGALRDENGYCCLGVLCDLHARASGGTWGVGTYLGEEHLLPVEVVEWAGLPDLDPDITFDEDTSDCLSSCNDHRGMSFVAIADIIEREL